MAEITPVIITVAPNGARKSKTDYPALPISPAELAETALDCLEAGAAMIHLHVRNAEGRHSILPEHYIPAIEEIDKVVGDAMIIQVTSESANLYDRHQQMQAMRSLMPESVSIALRELVPDENAIDDAANFFSDLSSSGSLIQYILYSPEELERYHELIERNVIPHARNLILFVLGQYGGKAAQAEDLSPLLTRVSQDTPWMCCAFGASEMTIMDSVIKNGGHTRVGFENNTQLVSGRNADSNSQLVALTAMAAEKYDRPLADARWVRRVHQGLWSDSRVDC